MELLESFSSLARRDSILRCVEKKSAEVHDKYIQEMGLVKNTFDKLKGEPPMIHRDYPRYAGAALWAKSLLARVQRQWSLLSTAASYLPPQPLALSLCPIPLP